MACRTDRPRGICGGTIGFSSPSPPFRTGSKRGEKRAAEHVVGAYLDQALADFSGYIAADELYVSTNIVAAVGADATYLREPSANVFARKYRPIVSTYLSNSNYTGYSTTAWYLLADPMDMATIEVAFLNGRETPVVESADADFNVLGIQMRGYFDFGVAKTEYRAGLKSKGAA